MMVEYTQEQVIDLFLCRAVLGEPLMQGETLCAEHVGYALNVLQECGITKVNLSRVEIS